MRLLFQSHKPNFCKTFASAQYRTWQCRRQLSEQASKFSTYVAQPSSKYQIYISRSNDPFLNLSIEHYLLQSTHPASTILFLYINRPCIVIGRNQNPWLETNLSLLGDASKALARPDQSTSSSDSLEIVRRRSGGGTVFHDLGNVNFSVICPPDAFTRDKHAEMVVRAIRHLNPRVRVNERHDIVLDTGPLLSQRERPPKDEAHRSAYEPAAPLKISGSAYKLTRTRALHHGTCLVNSPNTGRISGLLRSPLAPFVMARGVESVKSAVGNVSTKSGKSPIQDFEMNVIREFCRMYGVDQYVARNSLASSPSTDLQTFEGGIYGALADDLGQVEKIKSGIEEMKSPNWLYGHTPKFTFSTYATPEDNRQRPPLPASIPSTTKIYFEARSGKIISAQLSMSPSEVFDSDPIIGQEIHCLKSWKTLLRIKNGHQSMSVEHQRGIGALGDWLDELFGVRTV